MSYLEQSIDDLLAKHPNSATVLTKFGIDFTHNGQKRLGQVLLDNQLDFDVVTDALENHIHNTKINSSQDWRDANNHELIHHILARFHTVHRQELPELIGLAQKVERVHADDDRCPHGLANHLADMLHELDNHMVKEEQVLFPMLEAEQYQQASMPIRVMVYEHDSHSSSLQKLDELINGGQLPEQACHTWTQLYKGVLKFRDDLLMHIYLENNILFPRAF